MTIKIKLNPKEVLLRGLTAELFNVIEAHKRPRPDGLIDWHKAVPAIYKALEIILEEIIIGEKSEIKWLIENYKYKLLTTMPDGKLPFVVFKGKADEEEKKSIYFHAFDDIIKLLKKSINEDKKRRKIL